MERRTLGRALLAGLSLAAHGALALAVTRGPYLQTATSSSVIVCWRTDVPADGRVFAGTDSASLTLVFADPGLATEHAVAVTGLAPRTRYYYAIGTAAGVLVPGPPSSFVTPPPTGAATPLRIWAVGDSGTADANARAVRDAYLAYTGARGTDLWLMLGDNAYVAGTDAEYGAAVFGTFPGLLASAPLWPAFGNHDGGSANGSTGSGVYFDLFRLPKAAEAGGVASGSEAYYSFDAGNVHFVCLDAYDVSRLPGSPMLTWVAADLAATAQTWIVAYWHHPPYTKGTHDSDVETELVEMRQFVNPILEAAGVDLVLGGHSHVYERSYLLDGHYGDSTTFAAGMKKDGGTGDPVAAGPYRKPAARTPHAGTVYVVAGSGGQLGSGALNHPAMLRGLAERGSLVIDVNGARLDARFVRFDGVVRDSFAIVKSGLGFHPLTPCRAFDTRVGAAALAAGEIRRFVAPGVCGIPAGVSAVSANLTVPGASTAGTLVVFPGDLVAPPNVETVRFRAGQTRANNVLLGLASDGSGSFLVQNESASAVHAILDVNGYFE
jgi:acid phosphatase type 7